MGLIKNNNQKRRVADIFRAANGQWVDGMMFFRLDRPITQYHTRIWELEQEGFVFDSRFIEGKNWKEYKLMVDPAGTIVSEDHFKEESRVTKEAYSPGNEQEKNVSLFDVL